MSERFRLQDNPSILLDAVDVFYRNLEAPEIIYKQVDEVLDLVESLEGIEMVGAVLLGYPSYLGRSKLSEASNEIQRHIARFKAKIPDNYSNPCPECNYYGHTDLMKTVCKGCQFSAFKPRDVLKVIPDIDLLLIVNDLCLDTEIRLTAELVERGYTPPAFDFFNRIDRISRACVGPNVPLPMDLHLVEKKVYSQWTNLYDPANVDTYALNTRTWRGVGFNQTAVVDNSLLLGPVSLSTIDYLRVADDFRPDVVNIYKILAKWLESQGAENFDQCIEQLIAKTLNEGFFSRLCQQEWYLGRIKHRIRENLLLQQEDTKTFGCG